jgi:hypothetical protein
MAATPGDGVREVAYPMRAHAPREPHVLALQLRVLRRVTSCCGLYRWQARSAAWRAGLFRSRSLFGPAPWIAKSPLAVGSGKSVIPWERMHCEYLRALDSCDGVEGAEDAALDGPPADDERTLATLFEPPHAAASRARPAAATIAAAPRSASGDTRRGLQRE